MHQLQSGEAAAARPREESREQVERDSPRERTGDRFAERERRPRGFGGERDRPERFAERRHEPRKPREFADAKRGVSSAGPGVRSDIGEPKSLRPGNGLKAESVAPAREQFDRPHKIGPLSKRAAPPPVVEKQSRRTPPNQTRLYMNVGSEKGVAPRDVVGAIMGETGLPPETVGAVDIRERHLFVDVASNHANAIIARLNRTRIKGERVKVKAA
jgi:ATP-dependent RNA helicase DeaD